MIRSTKTMYVKIKVSYFCLFSALIFNLLLIRAINEIDVLKNRIKSYHQAYDILSNSANEEHSLNNCLGDIRVECPKGIIT